MQGEVIAHYVVLSVRTPVYVALIKVHSEVHIPGTGPSLFQRGRHWVAHVHVGATFVPFLKITTESAPHVQDRVPTLGHGLDQGSFGLVVSLP